MAKRIIFQSEQPLIAPGNVFTAFASGHVVHGVQSLGMNGTVPITTLYELGQAAPYEQFEEVSDFSVTMDKLMDGYPLIWHKATYDASTADLLGRSDSRCHLGINLFVDTKQYASGAAEFGCWMSGYYPSNLTYNIPVQGPCTESVSFVGNDRLWFSQNYRLAQAGTINILSGFFTGSAGFTIPDGPLAASGVMRREDVLFNYSSTQGTDANGNPVHPSGTTLPRNIPGMDASGRVVNVGVGGKCEYNVVLQSISFTASLARSDINQLGCKFPYFRSLNPTVDVNTSIEVIATSGDFVEALQSGLYANGDNTRNESIRLALTDGTRISTGTKNRMTGFSVGGGGTDGSNMTVTYTYNTKNTFDILHPQDPKFGSNQNGYTLTGGTGSGVYYN
jgi:hypothetical protein